MFFVVDAQLPPALARWLEGRGHKAKHVWEIGLIGANDAEIWKYALSAKAVLLTKDEDFSVRAATATSAGEGPPVVWIRIGNTANRALLNRLSALWPDIERALERKEKLIEVI